MTSEGIRYLRFQIDAATVEAIRCVRAAVLKHGEPYVRDVYALDEWDMQGVPEGKMAICKALKVLEKQNKLDAGKP